MITLSKLEPVAAGIAPITTYKPSKDQAVVRMTPVTSEQARSGWVATFIEDEWPKHSLYCVDSEDEARGLAQGDLDTLNARDQGSRWAPRRLDAYYWSVT